jgi:hypothetical protein
MVQDAYVVTGTLSDHRTVRLDEAVPLSRTKVRVTLEPLRVGPRRPYPEVLAEIRHRQRSRRHRPLTPDEVDRYLRAERDSWAE